ncbi:MAG: OmpA family protein [Kiloniellales bacterium]
MTAALAAPAPADEPSASQSAALTPDTGVAPDSGARVLFAAGSAELSEAGKRALATLADGLGDDSALRIQLLAYADGPQEGDSRARRLSLSRALVVRAFLIERGIRSTRMDVRALGNKTDQGPTDRVDVLPQG